MDFINNTAEWKEERHLVERVLEMILMALILVTSVIGNAFVCYMILKDRKLKRVSNTYMFNLALTDLGFSGTSIPISLIILVKDKFPWNQTVCDLNGTIMLIFGIASLLNLALISVTRYVTVCHASLKIYLTKLFYISSSAGSWIVSVIIAMFPSVGWGRIEFSYGKTACTHYWPSSISYTVFLITSAVFVPFGIIIISYGLLFFQVWNSKRRIRDHTNQTTFKGSDLKLAKIYVSVFASFVVCWAPISVTNFILLAGYTVPHHWDMLAMLSMYLNSVCNPFIYTLMSVDFRAGIKRVFCRFPSVT